jgi:uncharacterized phiE125 gp8 family phage protein
MRPILTITVPASVRALCLLADVKADLGITDGAQDAYLNSEIAAASRVIDAWCGRVLARETVQELRRDVYLDALVLMRSPVVSITSVVEDGVTLAAGDYEADADAGTLYRLSSDARTMWRASKITITYVAGYLLPSQGGRNLPEDIERAARLMVVTGARKRGRDLSVRSETAQDVGAVSYLDPREGMEAMPPEVAALLSPYRVWAC